MPRDNSTGVYVPPASGFNPAVFDQPITETDWNALLADFITALSTVNATTRFMWPRAGQVQDDALSWCGAAGGTADVITLTPSVPITAYAAGQRFAFVTGGSANTTTPTINVSGVGAQQLVRRDGSAITGGDLPANAFMEVRYDGTRFRLLGLTPSAIGGGATSTTTATSFSLTASSNRVQSVAFTADAQSVTLPDARSLSVGGPTFIISNAGSRTFGVRSGNPNLFADPGFDTPASWTAGTGWSVAAGLGTKTAGVQSDLSQAIATTSSIAYTVTFTVTAVSGGTVTPVLTGGGADVVGTARNAPGTYTETLVSNGNTTVAFRGNSTFAGSIDNVSITLTVAPALTWVPPGATAEFSLVSNATSAGVWTVEGINLAPAGTICDFTWESTWTQAVEVTVALSSTRSLHFARNASGHPAVRAVDHGTPPATVGAAQLIVASNLTVLHAFRISATKAMVVLSGGTSNVYNVTIDPVTLACTVSPSATAASFQGMTFTGAPLIAALGANSDLFVAIRTNGTTVEAQAVDCSGTNPSAGSTANISALGTGSVAVHACYRIDNTTALALYTDDSGSAGSPFSVRGVVLSLSGTTITVNTSAGVNDVVNVSTLPVCQLSATSYLMCFYQQSGTLIRALAATVSGTTVTFGSPLTIETLASAGTNDVNFTACNGNRFQPNLFPTSSSTALFSYTDTAGGGPSRHLVLSVSGTTVTANTILYGLWSSSNGGNFPQASDGFLAFSGGSNVSAEDGIFNVSVSGTTLNVTGRDASLLGAFNSSSGARFGLSGGVLGIGYGRQTSASGATTTQGAVRVLRRRANGGISVLGDTTINNMRWVGSVIPVEVAPSKAAFTGLSITSQAGSSTYFIRLLILEFAA